MKCIITFLLAILAVASTTPVCAEEQPPLRILCIGNSFSGDVVESWLSKMADKSGIQLVIGNAVKGGWGLREHWTDIVENNAGTEYRKISNGIYTLTGGHTLDEIIRDEPWDIITFQQKSEASGQYGTFAPYLGNLIDYVKNIHPNAKFGWLMTWTYANDSSHGGFWNYNHDQMTMYNAIVDATEQVMRDYPALEFMVPCGTTVQNLRSSFLGDRVNRDGTHLNMNFGRYAAAYTLFATLFGEETAMQNSFVPYCMNKFTMNVIRQAALDAVRNPFTVTPQVYPNYVEDNPVVPANIHLNFTPEKDEPSGWNNIGLHHNFLAGLKDAEGNDPGIFIFSNSEFSGADYNGPSVTNTPLNMSDTVSITLLYGYTEGVIPNVPQKSESIIQFHHLNKLLAYDFTFFSSQENMIDNGETQFTLAGSDTIVATINATSNLPGTVSVYDVCPNEDGTISLIISAGEGNNNPYKIYCLNALRISAYDPNGPNRLPTGCEKGAKYVKFIKGGHLYIKKDNRIYSPDGKRIK